MEQRNSKTADGRLLIVAACVVAVIIHGSLYPYAFHANGAPGAALKTLLGSWRTPPAGFSDFVANLFLYMPLGFLGVLAHRGRHRLALVTCFGLVLSVFVEIAQFFDLGRVTNMSDVYLNSAGTFLGGVAAVIVDLWARDRLHRNAAVEPIPLILLFALLAYRLYPYVPTIDVHKYWHSVRAALVPAPSAWSVFQSFGLWLTTFYLLRTALPRASSFAIAGFMLFIFAAKIVIVGLALSASDLIGGALALVLWIVLLERSDISAGITFVVLGAVVLLVRLQPFDFHTASLAPFGWTPFRSIVQGDLERTFVATGEKIFLYGSFIWIGTRAGLKLWLSTGVVAVLLLLTSLAETRLPGRSAEITDFVMAVLLGGGLAALRNLYPRHGRGMEEGHSRPEISNSIRLQS